MRHIMGITLFALTLSASLAGAAERLELKVGEQQRITVKELVRIALGNPDYAEVKTLGDNQVEVTGRAAGTTKLIAWNRTGDMTVYTVEVSEQGKPSPAAPAEETVTLKKGGTHELKLKDLSRVAVGDPEVADIQVSGKDALRITGQKAGETTLLVWTGDKQELRAYHVVVRE
ncbi:MAG TPA: pilus assembly protein N-terminal domain-containing protein [Myxococcus sp.]|jgi:pilus assembly protein CpaC|nr:pilus assembly protein N-terminal domain-containing protein [Myxococcus sp.]